MKRIALIYIFLCLIGIGNALAQRPMNPMGNGQGMNGSNRDRYGNQIDPSRQPDNLNDSTDIQSLPPKLYMWKLSEKLGNRTIVPADTVALNFQNSNLVEGMYGHYNYLGNLGSPRLSRIFFERDEKAPTIFIEPFSAFYFRPDQMLFTNSNIPYTNLTYYKAGNKVNGEERFKSYFSVNVNKNAAFGFNFDYLYGRGYYQNQNTAHFNVGLFGSYIGEKYQLQAVFNNFYMKMNENGGIADDQYITRPENMSGGKKEYESTTIPVKLEQTSNRNHDFYVYLTHRYRLGFTRRLKTVDGKVVKTEVVKKLKPAPQTAVQGDSLTAVRDSIAIGKDSIAVGKESIAVGKDSIAVGKESIAIGKESRDIDRDSLSVSNERLAMSKESLIAATTPGTKEVPLPAMKPATNDSLATAEPKDTITTEEFVPVTSFIHTVKLERSRHTFRSKNEPKGFFPPDPKLYSNHSNDSTTAISLKNTFGIALMEGFNKYAKAGLTAYITHKYSQYNLMNTDTTTNMHRLRYNEQEVFVGGELAKREGHTLHYNVTGEVGILDKAIGQFRIDANADLNFRLWKDTVNLYVRGSVSNTLPHFYMRHYHSNHYNWDNGDFDKVFRTRVEGELNINRWRTNLRFGIENLKNYTYFGPNALPMQSGDNIQVMSATLKQDFKLGIFHLDNEVTWQKSSNETVIPLPQLSLYHNFYILTKIAKKVLTVQLGADVRYFSKYYAPAYAPGIQQFHLQHADDMVEIGDYPIVNAYANLQLKRTRIFVMMYHVNAGLSKPNYFLTPHYPINQRLLKIGVSWNFYD